MVLTAIVGVDVAEQVAKSDKPWIYLTVAIMIMVVTGIVYVGKYLINLDKSNRDESKEREKHLLQHLDKQNECLDKITTTQNQIVVMQENISKDVSDLKGRVRTLEQLTYRKGGD